ncbi:MAG: sigma-54 dependent transcriptional regulator [Halieaceae bacterium]
MRIRLIDSCPSLGENIRKALAEDQIELAHDTDFDPQSCDWLGDQFDLVVIGDCDGEKNPGVVRRACWPTPVAFLSNEMSTGAALTAGRLGAVAIFDRSASAQDMSQWLRELCSHLTKPEPDPALGREFQSRGCTAMRTLNDMTLRVAQTDSAVLIIGETGTGKELTARKVHAASARQKAPLIAVNCAAIPETLIESELFGYEKGAFTGATSNRIGLIEAADGGTLFLDEIGELPLAAQARLLRFLQEGEIRQIGAVSTKRVDVRLICATHRNLAELAEKHEFRQDLFYRIDVLRLDIPPLRDRGEDIIEMAQWFIEQLADKLDIPPRPLSADSQRMLTEHPWPGNVRELQNVIERALVVSKGPNLQIDLPDNRSGAGANATENPDTQTQIQPLDTSDELSLEDYFQRFVLEHQEAMNETELAQKLGISRKCLWERRQRFGLPRSKQRSA